MKKIILTLAAFIMAMSANAQLLWKVSGNGCRADSYIFGTHHIAPVSILDNTNGFDIALSGVDQVYGEVDMSTLTDPTAQQSIVAMAMAPAASTLSKLLLPAQLDSLNTVLAKYTNGMSTVAQMEPLKPAMIATQLAAMQSMVAIPEFSQNQQLDQVIQEKARAMGKEIHGFETLAQQMQMLMGNPLTEQAADLMTSIRNDDKSLAMARELFTAYSNGNLAEMERIMTDPASGTTPESTERLINQRNATWAEKLNGLMRQNSLLVAVGAGHLPGEKGLLQLLRNAGFTVEPVK